MSKVEPPRNRYVGHRYVPKIFGEWDKRNSYEGLSIVTHQGTSYTSKQHVPVGVDILNETYWVVTGNYNVQVEEYRKDVRSLQETVNKKADQEVVNTINNQVIKSVNDIKELQKHTTNWVNALENGVKGDGITDDSIRINELIQTLQDGDVLYFPTPSVTYLLNNTIIVDKNVSIIGDDKYHTVFTYNGNGIAFKIDGLWNKIIRTQISNIKIVGTARQGVGLDITYGNDSNIQRVNITNFEHGIYFHRGWSVIVEKSSIRENKYGIYCTAQDVVNNITIRDCNVAANQTINIRLTGQNHTIDSCDFSNYDGYITDPEPIGIFVFYARSVGIVNCYYESGVTGARGINGFHGHGLTISNLIVSNLKDNCYVVRLQTTKNVTIDNINVIDWEELIVRQGSYGVYLTSSSSATVRNCIFSKLEYGVMVYYQSDLVLEQPNFISCITNVQIRDNNSYGKLSMDLSDFEKSNIYEYAWDNLVIDIYDVKKSSSTAARPDGLYKGQQYFNTTTNKLNLWNGSKWINTDGSDA